MTGLDQEALVKLAIAGAFDAAPDTQESNERDDGAILSQSIEDDTSAMHQSAGITYLFTEVIFLLI